MLRKKTRKKLAAAASRLRETPATAANERWTMDFMKDFLVDGRGFRTFDVLDEYTRECLALEAEFSLPAPRILRVLEPVVAERGAPREIIIDNGSEFTSKAFDAWAARHGITLRFIPPGRPVENPFIESFHGRLRHECLDANWFESIREAQLLLAGWQHEYNHERPHTSLKGRTPAEFAALREPPAPSGPQTPSTQLHQHV